MWLRRPAINQLDDDGQGLAPPADADDTRMVVEHAPASLSPMRGATAVNAALFSALVIVLGAIGLARMHDFRPSQHLDVWRGAFAHAFETRYDEAFPAKRIGVNLWAAIDYTLFKEGMPGVVVGKDGWLYTDEEFKLDNDSPVLVSRNLALIDWVKRKLARRHIALLVALIPAKTRVYPEHLDHKQPPGLRQVLYSRTLDTLRAERVATVDLLDPLRAGKRQQPTFLRTDTHWTPYGAQLAAQAIAVSAGTARDSADSFRTQAGTAEVHRGDLFNFLPLDPWFGWLLPPRDTLAQPHTISSGDKGSLLGGDTSPEVALVGTSYSAEPQWNFVGALEQAMQTEVLNYAKDGQGPFAPMVAYMHSADFRNAPPKLVVWEIPERYLPLPQTALNAYHLPPDAFVPDVTVASAAQSGPSVQEGGSSSHVTSKL